MIISITSKVIKSIWTLFLIIIILATLLFLVLKNGIRVEQITLPKFQIEQFYIKLDKKLIVSIDKVKIFNKNKASSSIKEIKNILTYIPYLNKFFDSISIRSVKLDDKEIKLLYKDNIFYIDSNFLSINSTIHPWKNSIEIKIKQMNLKDYKVKLKGNLNLNLDKKSFIFQGNFSTFNIVGNLNLSYEDSILNYKLSTKKFNTLKPFMDFLSKKIALREIISAWIYKRIVAKEYKLHYLEGKLNLETLEYYPEEMNAMASAKDVVVKFSKEVPAAVVDDLDIVLKDNKLIFKVKKATYEKKDISKSKIHIYNVLTRGAGIIIDIKTKTLLDDSIHKILKAFKIKIPIMQKSGYTDTNVFLDIDFEPIGIKSYKGTFVVKNSLLSISNVPMFTKKAYIELDNDYVYIKNSNLKYKKLFDLNTTGTFDIKKNSYKSINYINSLNVKLGSTELLNIKNSTTPSSLKVSKDGTTIVLNKLDTTLSFKQKSTFIVKNLKNLKKNSKIMQELKIDNADVFVETEDFKDFKILANIKKIDLPLYKNNKKVDSLLLNISTNGDSFYATSKDKSIKISQKDFLMVEFEKYNFMLNDGNSTLNLKQDLIVKAKNSNIILKKPNKILLSDKFRLKIDATKRELKFDSSFSNQSMHIEKNSNFFKVDTTNLNDVFINSLLGEKIFENGKFRITILGKNKDNFSGKFFASNSTLKRMKFYNNLMALINTVPSLLTFKAPGFNEDGFSLNKMMLDFIYKNGVITFKKIDIDGKSTDVIGHGIYNTKNSSINLTLQLSILKSLSSVVKNIPIVNYIILGKDNKFYTNISVSGDIDNLKIKTNILKDTAITPLDIIKRTLQTPFKIFEAN